MADQPKSTPAKTPIDPKASPPMNGPRAGVPIMGAPPLPPEQPTGPPPEKPAMESAVDEQSAGKIAMENFKKRLEDENSAGAEAVKRYSASRQVHALPPGLPPLGPPPTEPTKGIGPPSGAHG